MFRTVAQVNKFEMQIDRVNNSVKLISKKFIKIKFFLKDICRPQETQIYTRRFMLLLSKMQK